MHHLSRFLEVDIAPADVACELGRCCTADLIFGVFWGLMSKRSALARPQPETFELDTLTISQAVASLIPADQVKWPYPDRRRGPDSSPTAERWLYLVLKHLWDRRDEIDDPLEALEWALVGFGMPRVPMDRNAPRGWWPTGFQAPPLPWTPEVRRRVDYGLWEAWLTNAREELRAGHRLHVL